MKHLFFVFIHFRDGRYTHIEQQFVIYMIHELYSIMEIDKLFNLTGKVAVVRGGGDGIGRGCCKMLAAAYLTLG